MRIKVTKKDEFFIYGHDTKTGQYYRFEKLEFEPQVEDGYLIIPDIVVANSTGG